MIATALRESDRPLVNDADWIDQQIAVDLFSDWDDYPRTQRHHRGFGTGGEVSSPP